MCIQIDRLVHVPLNKKGLGIGYKIVLNDDKKGLYSPFRSFRYKINRWQTCDSCFSGHDSTENHGFHIYLYLTDAIKTAEATTWENLRIYKVYFKNVNTIGKAVGVCLGLEPLPCVVVKDMLIRKKVWSNE